MEGALIFFFGIFLAFIAGIINGGIRKDFNHSSKIGLIVFVVSIILVFVLPAFFGFLGSEFVFNDDFYKAIGVLFMFTGFLSVAFGCGTVVSAVVKSLTKREKI